jgi:putative flippase GtrA
MATEAPPPVDFYAAAVAAAAVVVFAKFVTHRDHAPADTRMWKLKWKWLHWACVVAAWTGFVVSLVVLGGLTSGGLEIVLRWAVGVLVVIAATILAIDVGRLERG